MTTSEGSADVGRRYLDGEYLANNPGWHEDDALWKFAQLAPLLEQIEFDMVADVGCGSGALLELCAARFSNAQYDGFDISPDLEPLWRGRSGEVRFHRTDFIDVDATFDVILLVDVFEHVEDYMGFLRAMRGRAERFVFHIPIDLFALAVIADNFPRKRAEVGHLHYFSRSTALATLSDCGYRIIDQRLTTPGISIPTETNRRLRVPRRLGQLLLGQNLNARVLGGYSLAVLAAGS